MAGCRLERRAPIQRRQPVVHPGVRTFGRTDPFSLALRLQPTERQDRAVVLHQSRAWTDAGSRGFELTLDHGRPVLRPHPFLAGQRHRGARRDSRCR